MDEPPTIEQRTQEALGTLQQHQDYCINLEKAYLFKHDELKMYTDYIRNINEELKSSILIEQYQDDSKLSILFTEMIGNLPGLKKQIESLEDLNIQKKEQEEMITTITKQFDDYVKIMKGEDMDNETHEYANDLNRRISPKMLENPYEDLNDYNTRQVGLNRTKFQMGGANVSEQDKQDKKHIIIQVLYEWLQKNTTIHVGILNENLHNYYNTNDPSTLNFIELCNLYNEIFYRSLSLDHQLQPLEKIIEINKTMGNSPVANSNDPALEDYRNTYQDKIQNYITYCDTLRQSYDTKHNIIGELYEYIQLLSDNLNTFFHIKGKITNIRDNNLRKPLCKLSLLNLDLLIMGLINLSKICVSGLEYLHADLHLV